MTLAFQVKASSYLRARGFFEKMLKVVIIISDIIVGDLKSHATFCLTAKSFFVSLVILQVNE